MKTTKEFFINPETDYRTDHVVTKEEYYEYGFENDLGWILVRQVNPELDAAYMECVEALRFYKSMGSAMAEGAIIGDGGDMAKDALDALKKARGE